MLSEVQTAIRSYILDNAGIFKEKLAPWGEELKDVYKYERANLIINDFPCIVLASADISSRFLAAPDYVEYTIGLQTMGYTLWDDTDENGAMATAFADSLRMAMEKWSLTNYAIPTEMMSKGQPVQLHCPVDRPPFPEYEMGYEVAQDQKTLIRTFSGTITCLCEAGIGAI